MIPKEILKEFIEKEREKIRTSSGDDMFYEQQLIDYINKQKALWIEYTKFVIKEQAEEIGEKIEDIIYREQFKGDRNHDEGDTAGIKALKQYADKLKKQC